MISMLDTALQSRGGSPIPARVQLPFQIGQEIGMTKRMTYWEQLQHPNWQRRRLEKMEQAGFECEDCGDADNMLHVHHKHYIKGRMAWEYSDEELMVLCKDCHANHHSVDEDMKEVLASTYLPSSYALIAAATEGLRPELYDAAFARDHHAAAVGTVTRIVSYLTLEQMYAVAKFAVRFAHGKEADEFVEKAKHPIFQVSDK